MLYQIFISLREITSTQTGTLGSCWSSRNCWRPCVNELLWKEGTGRSMKGAKCAVSSYTRAKFAADCTV